MTAILDRGVHGRHLGSKRSWLPSWIAAFMAAILDGWNFSWLPSWMAVFMAAILDGGVHDRHGRHLGGGFSWPPPWIL